MVRLGAGVNGYDVATMAPEAGALLVLIRVNSPVNGANSDSELR
jgi:hypothetical protein